MTHRPEGDTFRMAQRPFHRDWLSRQAAALIEFHKGALNPEGGFSTLGMTGKPLDNGPRGKGALRELHDTCRVTHCYAAAHLLGHPSAAGMVDHGMRYILDRHRDAANGGYFWSLDDEGPVRSDKLAYGHAFVLLAAASAGAAGHPEARALHDDILQVIRTRFWDDAAGAMSEQFDAAWAPLDGYRGMNSNMHTLEALLAAYDTWAEPELLVMAMRIADLFANRHARAEGWGIPEHYDSRWRIDRDYEGDPMFRPAGTTPGHALEWSRLLVQLWHLDGRKTAWLPEAAAALFDTATRFGWSEDRHAFHYTLDWSNKPLRRQNYWWPVAEGAAAAHVLGEILGGAQYERWYRRCWEALDRRFIDHTNGGWWHEIAPDGQPAQDVFKGKPDIYHALQACLIPLLPATLSMNGGLARDANTHHPA